MIEAQSLRQLLSSPLFPNRSGNAATTTNAATRPARASHGCGARVQTKASAEAAPAAAMDDNQ